MKRVEDSRDTHFNSFGVWQDRNSDGLVDAGEFNSLTAMGIVSISLVSDGHTGLIEGNIINGYSSYTTSDGGPHTLADVGLLTKDTQVQITPQDVLDSENVSIDSIVNSPSAEPAPPITLVAGELTNSMDGQEFAVPPPALNQDLDNTIQDVI